MAVIPIIQQTWDTSSYVNPTRMNNIETNIGIVSKATGVEYSSGVSVKDKIDEVDKIRIISGNLPSNVTSTSVGQNIDLLSVNENLGTDYAVLAVNIYVFGQNRSLMNEFEQTAIISGNTSTIVGVGLLKALTNSQYNNASVTIILGKLT